MSSQPAPSAKPGPATAPIPEPIRREIEAWVRAMSDADLRLHRSLNHMERTPGVYGDIPAVAGYLEYEAAAIEDELGRREARGANGGSAK